MRIRDTFGRALLACLLTAAIGGVGCSSTDAGDGDGWDLRSDVGAPTEGGSPDGGPSDPGPADTGPSDTGPADPGPTDTGPIDPGPCGDPTGTISEVDFGDVADNQCDPVGASPECNGFPDLRCLIRVDINQTPPEFIAACSPPHDIGEVSEGGACGSASDEGARCRLGLFCTPWSYVEEREPRVTTCNQLCEMSDDRGCDDGSFCVQQFPELPGVGVCVASCDPYAADACPAGQICAPDFAYPQKSRTPNFRCRRDVQDADSAPSANGEPCSMGTSGDPYRHCAGADVCYPRNPGAANERASCERPCQADADCAGLGAGYTCPECGQGPWNLRFCQPPAP